MRKKRYRILWHRVIIAVILLILIITSSIKIISYFSRKQTNAEQTYPIDINYHAEQKNAKNTVKIQNTAYRSEVRLCGLESIICPEEKLDKISQQIKKIADEYQIDWKLAVAIAKHETGNYTSKSFNNLNNVGGNIVNGKLKEFATLEEGINYFISNLKRNYLDKGLDTIEKIQKIYAPIGAQNDPEGLNNYWTSSVRAIYESLEG